MLVVLYSINVFLAFSLSILGLCVYWIKQRKHKKPWLLRLSLSTVAFILCAFILSVTVVLKFNEGGWLTIILLAIFVLIILKISMRANILGLEKSLENIGSVDILQSSNGR